MNSVKYIISDNLHDNLYNYFDLKVPDTFWNRNKRNDWTRTLNTVCNKITYKVASQIYHQIGYNTIVQLEDINHEIR